MCATQHSVCLNHQTTLIAATDHHTHRPGHAINLPCRCLTCPAAALLPLNMPCCQLTRPPLLAALASAFLAWLQAVPSFQFSSIQFTSSLHAPLCMLALRQHCCAANGLSSASACRWPQRRHCQHFHHQHCLPLAPAAALPALPPPALPAAGPSSCTANTSTTSTACRWFGPVTSSVHDTSMLGYTCIHGTIIPTTDMHA